jgi:hypothetical protein
MKLAPALDRTLVFGGQSIQLTTAAIQMRDGSTSADDAIPGFATLSPEAKAVPARAAAVLTLDPREGMRLTGVQARLYHWADLDFSNGMANPRRTPVAGQAAVNGVGGAAVTMPAKSGDYAYEFMVQWLTPCLSGDGAAYARVLVR